ncbi:hypothetical protein U9M48_001546, partial [Paspalum notatum var. saurae]
FRKNEVLVEKFTEEEVKFAIFQMKHNKAPGPDGFPPKFYQVFWNIIKEDLMNLEAKQIQQYRPICLLNVSFKIFTKVGTNMLTHIAQRVIRPSQTAFLPGRNIMEGAVILHETLHELYKKKQNGLIFKIDFENAYDKIRIKVNDQVGAYFQTKKGLRQGDPLSPLLFNIVVDMLAILLNRATTIGQISGVIPHLMDDGFSILHYADDMVIFLDHDLEQAKNLKLLLCIIFHKSELFYFGQAKQEEEEYPRLFRCKLGIPMHFRKLGNRDWKLMLERFEKRLSRWKGKHLSVRGRLVLINLSHVEFLRKRITIDLGFIGRMINIKRNTALLDGISCAKQNNKGEGNGMFRWNLHSNGSCTVQSMYKHLTNNNTRVSQDVWCTRLPLKIKNLHVSGLLIKDNLNRRNWRGNYSCVFHSRPKTIQHLFFEYSYAKFLWRMGHIALDIAPPLGTNDVFGNWSHLGRNNQSDLILLGAAGVCCALWLFRNEVVLFRGAHWLRSWAKLQQSKERMQ